MIDLKKNLSEHINYPTYSADVTLACVEHLRSRESSSSLLTQTLLEESKHQLEFQTYELFRGIRNGFQGDPSKFHNQVLKEEFSTEENVEGG